MSVWKISPGVALQWLVIRLFALDSARFHRVRNNRFCFGILMQFIICCGRSALSLAEKAFLVALCTMACNLCIVRIFHCDMHLESEEVGIITLMHAEAYQNCGDPQTTLESRLQLKV